MKKILTLFAGMLTLSLFAQNLETKIPPNAFFVSDVAGKNLWKKATIDEIQKYGFIGYGIFQKLDIESFEDIGIDLQKNSIQYGAFDKGVYHFAVLFYLEDAQKFEKYAKSNLGSKHIVLEETFSYMQKSNDFLAWNDQIGVFIVTESPYMLHIEEDQIKAEYHKMKREEAKAVGGSYVEEENPKIDWETKRDIKRKLREGAEERTGLENLNRIFGATQYDTKHYFKERDPEADFYAFLSYDRYRNLLYPFHGVLYSWRQEIMQNNQYDFTYNGFFEEKQLKVLSEVIPKNEEAKKALKKLYDSKIDAKLLHYVGENPMAYGSVSMNSEALFDQYYQLMKLFINQEFKDDLTEDHIETIIEWIALVIDEKAIAELFPGDGIFVLDTIAEKNVEYTDYEYDEEHNRIEKKGYKKELVPEFTFLFTTENQDFMKRLLRIPNLEKKHDDFVYTQTGEVHHLYFEGEYIANVYACTQNGMVMVTTSKEKVEAFEKKNKLAAHKVDKKLIRKNTIAAKIDMKKMLTSFKNEFNESEKKSKIWEALIENVDDYTITGNMKGDRFASELLLKTDGTHKNSFVYIFDLIDYIGRINKDEQKSEVRDITPCVPKEAKVEDGAEIKIVVPR